MKRFLYPLSFLGPSVLLLAAFVYLPLIVTFEYSLQHYKLTEPGQDSFVGLLNYLYLLSDKAFQMTLLNNAFILLFVLAVGLVLSIIMGLVLNKKNILTPLLTALIIIPWALPPLINGIIWKFIFFPGYGFLNKLLLLTGIIDEPIAWTSSRLGILVVVSLAVVWRSVPFGAVLVLANLQHIPQEYYDAFYMDGGSPWQAFRRITLPLIAPSLAIIVVTFLSTAVSVFDEIIALSGYRFESQSLEVYTYMTTFNFLDFGTGSAVSYIAMLLSGIIGYFYIRYMKIR
ncbi:carbohydrate ABC transporter permease [uncultured Megasphaera sp.]|uniref:carbohydrate ABC transporter permease n=1 Tax=uncultured Megasphaera sp. TaxID=165188 RepID=UPI00265A2DAE|nr:sugar ABC transporter permease [uncultured Megasphaera sp.]